MVLLSSSSYRFKFCENLILEDNFNNTLLKTCPSKTLLCLGIDTKLISMFSFKKKDNIGNYVVTFPIKEGAYAETYRVKDSNSKNYFLKLINCSKLHRTQFSEFGEVLEIEL